MVEAHSEQQRHIITLRPNRSLSWPQAQRWLWLLAIPVATVALGWWLAGVWMILPFAGLELGLLWLVMVMVAGQTCRREVLIIEADRIVVHQGRHYPETLWVLSRPQAHLQVTHPEKEVDMLELQLVDQDFRLAIGGQLNQDDRRQLRRLLLDCGLTEVSNRWWQQA